MGKPHIVAVPFPGQGHVMPIMELSQCLVEQGFKVTVVNTTYYHKQVTNALTRKENECSSDEINLVSVSDGLDSWEDRNSLEKIKDSISRIIPGKVEELIHKINENEDDKVTCVLCDLTMGVTLEIAEKMNIPRATFWPASAATLCTGFCIRKLIEDGIIDNDGAVLKSEMIRFAPEMPEMNPQHFMWSCMGGLGSTKVMLEVMTQNIAAAKLTELIFCNSTLELEHGAFKFWAKMLPIGPLLPRNRLERKGGHQSDNFWKEDTTCLRWLDQQPPNSVTYVAFGTISVFDKTQFEEMALGLELTGRPFLWVVRPDIIKDEANVAYPNGFLERVTSAQNGQIVSWSPQKKVLSHPSIACFISHCGWNSTIEGVSSGVPFLCWPYFADQFVNEDHICDVWKNGLRLKKDPNGKITRYEIKNKLDWLYNDNGFKARALEMKELVMNSVAEGGSSNKNFKIFVEWIKSHTCVS